MGWGSFQYFRVTVSELISKTSLSLKVRRTSRHAARGRHDGVPQDRPGPRDVRRQLLRDQEQEGNGAMAGCRRPRPQHLREGGHIITSIIS